MANVRELTKAELLEVAQGIATGRDVIEIAGQIGVDRSTLSGWLAGADFLRRVARSLSSPADLGAALDDLRADDLLDGERTSSWQTRRKFWQIVEAAFPAHFAQGRSEAEQNAECAKADRAYTIDAMILLEDRGWEKGTADERKRGLNTKRLRRSHRCKSGIEWDWDGLGCYFQKGWSAWKCRLRYADEDGLDFLEQQRLFGTAWDVYMASECSREELEATNTRQLEVNRDPRLPTTLAEAQAFLEAVQGGADFAEAAQTTTAPSSSTGRNTKKGKHRP